MGMCECDPCAPRGGSVWIRGPYACHQGHHSGPSAPFLAPELQISHIESLESHCLESNTTFFTQVSHVEMHWCSGGNEDMRLIPPNSCDKTIGQLGLKFMHLYLICCHDASFQCTILSTKLILICACLSSMMMKVASHG